jgi:hypothetical protein
MVYLSFAPSLVPAGGMKLPADLTARQVMIAMCLMSCVSVKEFVESYMTAIPAAELRYVQV